MITSLTIGKRYPSVSQILALIGLAMLMMPLVPTAAAAPVETDVSIEDRVATQLAECTDQGGTPEAHYELDIAGISSAQVICTGGDLDGRVCNNTPTTVTCLRVPIGDQHAAPPAEVAEDPTRGDDAATATRTVADQVGACETFGGTATVTDNRSTAIVTVRCDGGMLDGMSCINGHYDTFCSSYRSTTDPEQDASGPPTGGVAEDPTGTTPSEITFVRVASEAELEATLRSVAEDPTRSDTVVVYNQSGLTLNQRTNGQGAICQGLGGIPVNVSVEAGAHVFVCVGGLLDGLTCFNSDTATNCMFVSSVVVPEEVLQVIPTAGVEAPAEDAPTVTAATEAVPIATATATAAPTMPVMAPTDVPAEPTVAPPSNPPPPRNDTNVPPSGPVEDPTAPTPTPVVLT